MGGVAAGGAGSAGTNGQPASQGGVASAMSAIAINGGNIFNMKVTDRNPLYFEFIVDVEVRDVAHLQNILGALRVSDAVESVDRVREAETVQ